MGEEGCGNCRFYYWIGDGAPKARCRRHPPTPHGWPRVHSDDWCGDYAAKDVSQPIAGMNRRTPPDAGRQGEK